MNVLVDGATHRVERFDPYMRCQITGCSVIWIASQPCPDEWPYPVGALVKEPVDCMLCLVGGDEGP